MVTLSEIRTRLTEAIRTSGMTQVEISRRLGISAPTVAQYISGRSMPALDTFANLCKILDVDANDILCIID